MLIPTLGQGHVPSSKLPLLLPSKRYGRKFRPTLAKKPNADENSQTEETKFFNLRFSKALFAKSAIVVFGLGFIDAGYSGDWSRIGVISRETEEFLKTAAYIMVPLCLLLLSIVSDEEKAM